MHKVDCRDDMLVYRWGSSNNNLLNLIQGTYLGVVMDTVYHGTTEKDAFDILQSGIKIKLINFSSLTTMVNDLGCGFYTYCKDDRNCYDPKKNASRYVRAYKNNVSTKFKVLELSISETNSSGKNVAVLDLDDEEEKEKFIKMREQLDYKIQSKLNKIKDSGAKRRNNQDGLFLEYMFENKIFPNTDIVVKETFTDFTKTRISNFTNGRELVIRNKDFVKNIKY